VARDEIGSILYMPTLWRGESAAAMGRRRSLLTDTPGVMVDPKLPDSLIARGLSISEAREPN
jgi:hypothetical protein